MTKGKEGASGKKGVRSGETEMTEEIMDGHNGSKLLQELK